MKERILTLPNLLTLSRIPMAAAVWIAPDSAPLVISLMVAAAVTDVADGRFARAVRASRERRGQDPGLVAGAKGIGAWLDPLCDKTFVVSLVIAIWVVDQPPVLDVVLIALRELCLVPLAGVYKVSRRLRETEFDFRAGIPGKLATVSQFVAVALIIVAPEYLRYASVAAGAFGLIATGFYLRRFARSMRAASDVPGHA